MIRRLILLIAPLAGFLGCATPSQPESRAWVDRAPAFEATQLDGSPLHFEPSQLERPTLLAFWASWCAGCREDLPALGDLSRQHQDELSVIGVSVDRDVHTAFELARTAQVPYANLDDAQLSISDLFEVHAIPSFVLVDRRGRIAYRGRAFDGELLEAIARLR